MSAMEKKVGINVHETTQLPQDKDKWIRVLGPMLDRDHFYISSY